MWIWKSWGQFTHSERFLCVFKHVKKQCYFSDYRTFCTVVHESALTPETSSVCCRFWYNTHMSTLCFSPCPGRRWLVSDTLLEERRRSETESGDATETEMDLHHTTAEKQSHTITQNTMTTMNGFNINAVCFDRKCLHINLLLIHKDVFSLCLMWMF